MGFASIIGSPPSNFFILLRFDSRIILPLNEEDTEWEVPVLSDVQWIPPPLGDPTIEKRRNCYSSMTGLVPPEEKSFTESYLLIERTRESCQSGVKTGGELGPLCLLALLFVIHRTAVRPTRFSMFLV
jgi:hypothetical protein